jgi:hypothetical protein
MLKMQQLYAQKQRSKLNRHWEAIQSYAYPGLVELLDLRLEEQDASCVAILSGQINGLGSLSIHNIDCKVRGTHKESS